MTVVVGGSGGAAFVVMMDPADLRRLDHSTSVDGVDLTRLRAVHIQRPMNPPLVTVVEVLRKDPTQMPFIDDDLGADIRRNRSRTSRGTAAVPVSRVCSAWSSVRGISVVAMR